MGNIGRPRKDPEEVRSKSYRIRLTNNEKDALENAAVIRNCDQCQVIRDALDLLYEEMKLNDSK